MNRSTQEDVTLTFTGHSLKTKLTAVIVLAALLSIIFGSVILVLNDISDYRKNLSSKMLLMAKTVGNYSATDIAFTDRKSAAETLSNLDESPDIINAHLYDKNGKWFTSYRQLTIPPKLTETKQTTVFNSNNKTLTINTAIDFRKEHWGYIQLIASTDDLNSKIVNRLTGVFFISLFLVVFAYLVASRLQRIISKPILSLAKTAQIITTTTDYSLRVDSQSNDEIGVLYKSFNSMLKKIESNEKERDLALKALSESEARFAAMFNSIPDAVMFADTDRKIVLNNPAVLKMFQYNDDELCGNTTEMLYANKDEFVNQGEIRFNPESKGDPSPYEVQHKRKNGEIFWTETLSAKVVKEGGQHIGFIGILRDITERKHNEEELQKYRNELEHMVSAKTRELEATNKELESFSYSVSHDLRSPLRSISGFSLALLEDYEGKLDEGATSHLKRIRQNAKRMDRLIKDLLKMSRVTQKNLNITQINLSHLAQQICDRLREDNPQRSVNIKINCDLSIEADEGLFSSLLENLLSNAWKYTSNKENAEIEFGKIQGESSPTFYIKDNGAGFNMQYANKLFMPFQRLHSSNEFEGTGVGLATVQRIINRHGGRIWAESEVGVGTCFYFNLPSPNRN